MDTEKKETSEIQSREELIKGLSEFIDQTIAEVEELTKGEVTFKDLSLQPDEQGDMPKEAGQPADDFKGMKKEDEEKKEEDPKKEEEKKEEEKPLEKEIPAELSEPKKEEAKEEVKEEPKPEEEKKDEEEEEKEEEAEKSEAPDAEYEKFKKYLHKALSDLGLFSEAKKEEPVAKSEAPVAEEAPKAEDELKKALEARDSKIEGLEKTVKELTETVEKISRVPQARKSLSGLKPIRKSESDGSDDAGKESLQKGEVLDKLVDLLKSGDKRVNPALITKFELTGDPELVRDILRK